MAYLAQFYIELDKDYYFSGDMVNGNVLINNANFIPMSTGISLKFTGYQVVKFLHKQQVQQTRMVSKGQGQNIQWVQQRIIPLHQIYQQDHPPQVSQVQSQTNINYDHRPKYIRYNNTCYQMSYFQTRNAFTKNKMFMFNTNGLQAGQYSFPFSFKTFEGWPASFNHRQRQKKGLIVYTISAIIEPESPQFQMKYARQITLRETRLIKNQISQGKGEVSFCCCCNKGVSSVKFHLEKDGYMPGQMVKLILQVDNSQCEANIQSIRITVSNQVTMRSQGSSTNSNFTVYTKLTQAVPAKQTRMGQAAIMESFQLNSDSQIKPSCTGKLLSSQFFVNIALNHEYGCDCCTQGVSTRIPIIIFPNWAPITMPSIFQNNWAPQMMPSCNLLLNNDFANFNINAMNNMGNNMGYPSPPPIQPLNLNLGPSPGPNLLTQPMMQMQNQNTNRQF